MRFKQWLHAEAEGAATTMMHGGIQDVPGAQLNLNLPVRSKISTKDGSDAEPPDAADEARPPEQTFGFRSPSDRNASRERAAQWIDKGRRRARFVTIPPDTIY